jgi:hypothetical protein
MMSAYLWFASCSCSLMANSCWKRLLICSKTFPWVLDSIIIASVPTLLSPLCGMAGSSIKSEWSNYRETFKMIKIIFTSDKNRKDEERNFDFICYSIALELAFLFHAVDVEQRTLDSLHMQCNSAPLCIQEIQCIKSTS